MIAHAIFFYIFSFIAVFSAVMVTVSKNTVHSVFFLILDFISISCLFIMIGAEFLGMIMLIVYVGAVAVLFLFVVMMLNINNEENKLKVQKYTPLTLFLVSVVFIELAFVFISDNKYLTNLTKTKNLALENNTVFIGNILYTDYALLFQLSGIILLVAMIGAIVLTLRTRDGVKKQIIRNQIDIKKSDVIQIVNVKNREGA